MQLVLLHRNEPDGDLDWSVLVGSGNLAHISVYGHSATHHTSCTLFLPRRKKAALRISTLISTIL